MVGASRLFMHMDTVLKHWPNAVRARWPLVLLLGWAQQGAIAQAVADLTLTLSPGDTLIGISQRYLAEPKRWPELQRLNHIAQDRRLQPGAFLQIPVGWLRWTERTADVIHVQGNVLGVMGGAPSAVGEQLSVGMKIKAGDSFDTGPAGALTLRMPDGALVVFPSKTQATLGLSREVTGTAVRMTQINLTSGSADSTVPPLKDPASRFEIRTPRVITAVRGTRFRVTADGDVSRHEVVSGVVAVDGSAGHASLNQSQGLRADGGRLGTVVPLLPAANVSGLPDRIERTAQSLSVPALVGAQGWRWQVASDAAFTRLLQDEQTAAPTWLLTDLADGDYHLRVRAADAQNLEGQEAHLAFALRARPEPPLMISPAANDSVSGASELVWAEGVNAPAYQVQVARDARFTDRVLDLPKVTGNRVPMDAAWAPGTYFWRVATLRVPGQSAPFAEGPRGPFGDSASFTLLPPSAMMPPAVGERGMTLAWSGPAGFSHRVQVSTDANFLTTAYDQVVPGSRLELPKPDPDMYYVRTQVILSKDRVGQWSSVQRFEVPRNPPWALLLLLLPLL